MKVATDMAMAQQKYLKETQVWYVRENQRNRGPDEMDSTHPSPNKQIFFTSQASANPGLRRFQSGLSSPRAFQSIAFLGKKVKFLNKLTNKNVHLPGC